MSDERRRTERRTEAFPVAVTAVDSPPLTGETVNLSSQGVLLTASGSIQLRVTIKGRDYMGRLVRALPVDTGETVYAVELEHAVPLASPSTA